MLGTNILTVFISGNIIHCYWPLEAGGLVTDSPIDDGNAVFISGGGDLYAVYLACRRNRGCCQAISWF